MVTTTARRRRRQWPKQPKAAAANNKTRLHFSLSPFLAAAALLCCFAVATNNNNNIAHAAQRRVPVFTWQGLVQERNSWWQQRHLQDDAAAASSDDRRILQQQQQDSTFLCRMTIMDTMYADTTTTTTTRSEEAPGCIPMLNATFETMMLWSVKGNLPSEITSHPRYVMGLLLVEFYNATLREEEATLLILTNDDDQTTTYQIIESSSSTTSSGDESGGGCRNDVDDTNLQRLVSQHESLVSFPPVLGVRTVILVRVTTLDGMAPTYTLTQMRAQLFESTIGMRSQYLACSFLQLQLDYAGELEIVVPQTLDYYVQQHPQDPMNALSADAQQAFFAILGNANSPLLLADHFMIVLPHVTGGWAASASIRHWRSVFNDVWGLSLTATIHEMGHNLGLGHSGEGVNDAYGDVSGYMGYGSLDQQRPRKCFNAVHNVQLGWYRAREHTIVNAAIPGVYELVAFTDYTNKALKNPNQYVLINIADQYVLQFNRAKAFNAETEERANAVTIVSNSDAVVGWTLLQAGLANVGDFWVGTDFLHLQQNSDEEEGVVLVVEQRNLMVQICAATPLLVDGSGGGGDVVDSVWVSIGLDGQYCDMIAPSASPSSHPSAVPTISNAPTVTPQPTPSPTSMPTTTQAPTLSVPPSTPKPCIQRGADEPCRMSSDCCGMMSACIIGVSPAAADRQCWACRMVNQSCNRADECCGGTNSKCRMGTCVNTATRRKR